MLGALRSTSDVDQRHSERPTETPVSAARRGLRQLLTAADPSPFLVAHRRLVIFALHLVLVPLAYWIAYALRFDFAVPGSYLHVYAETLPVLLVVRLAVLWGFRMYNGWWRHVGMYDLIALVRATTVSSLVFVAAIFQLGYGASVPRSIVVLDWVLAILMLGGVRFIVRWLREGSVTDAWHNGGRRTLIIGACDGASRLLREVRLDPSSGIHPVGLLDDDPNSVGAQLHGVGVLGTPGDLRSLAERYRIELLIVASPMVSRDQMQQLMEQCAGMDVEVKIVPPLGELVDGRARLGQLRNVDIEDLLGRTPVELDLQAVADGLRGRTVLITGGAGSIGSELARQTAKFGARRIVLVEKAESPLYFVTHELTRSYPGVEVAAAIADVTHRARVAEIFREHRPDVVFHAAAYKHVPLMEAHVSEAVRNNVLGTLCIAEAAVQHAAERFVLISSDKAVRPSSVMGATKRIAERMILGLPHLRSARTEFRAVRFGNVLGSDGSVVPLFKRQIAAGGPVTVTHPEVTRYFMTIPEAVQLVLQAATLSEAAGMISMLEMGQPVRIVELAENLIRLSGMQPYTEMPIVFTGLRPGEKLHEELQNAMEQTVPTAIEKIRVVDTEECGWVEMQEGLERLKGELAAGDTNDLLATILQLVPESVSPLRERGGSRIPEYSPVVALRGIRGDGPVTDAEWMAWQ